VNGLNKFQVGTLSIWPTEGSAVDPSQYTVCGTVSVSVYSGLVVPVNCAPSAQTFRYVIVQSLDTKSERLCIAEVAVFEAGDVRKLESLDYRVVLLM